jgi:hypothetical protein
MVDSAPPARSESSNVVIEAVPKVPLEFPRKREVKRPLEDVILLGGAAIARRDEKTNTMVNFAPGARAGPAYIVGDNT